MQVVAVYKKQKKQYYLFEYILNQKRRDREQQLLAAKTRGVGSGPAR